MKTYVLHSKEKNGYIQKDLAKLAFGPMETAHHYRTQKNANNAIKVVKATQEDAQDVRYVEVLTVEVPADEDK